MSLGVKDQIYGNYKVFDKEGSLIFRCDQKKFNWYLRKGLADKISEFELSLNFKTSGNGYKSNKFFLQDRKNICVVCGVTKNLSRHHVVPHCYRKHFPEKIKKHNYYDILPLCVDCHDKYESGFALLKRKELSEKYNAPVHGTVFNNLTKEANRAHRAANTLVCYETKIPELKVKELNKIIQDYLGRKPSKEEIKQLAEIRISRYCKGDFYKSHGELVVSCIKDINSFIQEWRSHFVESMSPQYLPVDWKIDEKVIL